MPSQFKILCVYRMFESKFSHEDQKFEANNKDIDRLGRYIQACTADPETENKKRKLISELEKLGVEVPN